MAKNISETLEWAERMFVDGADYVGVTPEMADDMKAAVGTLNTIATTSVDWTKLDHHYYAGILGRFQMLAHAALSHGEE